jgi:hypothetical protein
MKTSTPGILHVVSRVAASLLGGYAFVFGFTTLGVAVGVSVGMDYHDAEALFFLLAFLVFLLCFFWAFAALRLAQVWAVLAGGGALLTVAGWLVTRSLV